MTIYAVIDDTIMSAREKDKTWTNACSIERAFRQEGPLLLQEQPPLRQRVHYSFGLFPRCVAGRKKCLVVNLATCFPIFAPIRVEFR